MSAKKSSPKVPAAAGCREQRWWVLTGCFLLAVIIFAVFGQTLRHEFVDFDDSIYVYENPVVVQGLTRNGIVWAFTNFYADNWHPLTWLSHMLDCQLYGLHPLGHHLTNVLFHTATAMLLFLVLRQLTGALWRSAFVAAVFAIHPLRVESVAWVAERKDVLSGLFFMLTIGAYVRYARRPWSLARYGLVVLLFAMGLMSKPMLVTLPLVLLLLDYWPLQRAQSAGKLVVEKLPLLALSAASCVATLLAQSKAIKAAEICPLPARLGNALVTCMVYFRQMVYPAGLEAFYPFPLHGPPAWEVALAGMLLAGLSFLAWGERRKRPWMLMGWLWYLVTLLPVVGIIQVGNQAHADRYTYLPQIGIYVALTWTAAELGATWKVGRAIFGGLATVMLAALMFCAWKQTAYWRNTETLWTHAIACDPDNPLACYNLGNVLLGKERFDEAISYYQNALRFQPNFALAHNNLGDALSRERKVNEAITQYQEALQISPGFAEFHENLGNELLQQRKLDEAEAQYEKTLDIKPDHADANYHLGQILLQKGQLNEAITRFEKELQIKPDHTEAHMNLGNIFGQQGRMDAAISQYQAALQTKPDNPVVQNNLAWLLASGPEASLRNGGKAVELASQANVLTGGKNPVILHTLAAAFAEAGRFSEAMETAQRALQLAGAQSNTGLAGQLQYEMQFYQAGSPFHLPAQTH